MPKAVIFDVDGTLVDSVDLHAMSWREAFRDFGHDVAFQAIRQQIGKGGDHLMPVFLSPEALAREAGELERHRAEIFKHKYLPDVTAFPAVRSLFLRLIADNWKIALASSAKQDELQVYVKIAGIEDLVDTATTSEDAESSKPSPDIFQAALSRLGGIDPDDAVAVGDTPYDAEAAKQSGIRTIGLLCGGFAEPDLRQAGCIAIYRDPAHLLAEHAKSNLGK